MGNLPLFRLKFTAFELFSRTLCPQIPQVPHGFLLEACIGRLEHRAKGACCLLSLPFPASPPPKLAFCFKGTLKEMGLMRKGELSW